MQIEPIPFHSDISLLFSHFAEEEQAILFDSGRPDQQNGRFDILSAWPLQKVSIKKNSIHHADSDKNDHIISNIDKLKALLSKSWNTKNCHLPFCGGWIGFASYELGYLLEPTSGQPRTESLIPTFWAAYYNWAIIQDHETSETYLVYEKTISSALLAQIRQRINQQQADTVFCLTESFQQSLQYEQYREAFNQIQNYLDAGDCYQVNFAMRYHGSYQGQAFQAFRHLRKTVPSPYMAFFNHQDNGKQQQILSISPERFISADQSKIQTRPIKGTAPRFKNSKQDLEASSRLTRSSKNRAENLMIVDLLRNDLGHHCIPGSIQVDELFALETYNNVHHLVSTISGEIKTGSNIWDVFFSCFPGGSITGAPKIRACQIINELEPNNREIYCGSLFYASNNGRFDANISIRTLLCDNGNIYAWAGGGIVKDSTAEEEYQECQNKIGTLLDALETIRKDSQ